MTIVNPNRLTKPEDKFHKAFPEFNFREVYSFQTSGEPVLLTDPTYLADVYNSGDEIASFLRAHGIFVIDFGGDVSSPVWWQPPFVLLPISMHISDRDLEPPEEVTVLAEEVGTDSGSFVFLPLTEELPWALKARVDKVLAENNGALLELPAGKWGVFYEQQDAPEERLKSLYRNIVLKWEPVS
jgi:hypothetical protein